MEKRLIAAIALSILILVGYQMLFMKKPLNKALHNNNVTTQQKKAPEKTNIQKKKKEAAKHAPNPNPMDLAQNPSAKDEIVEETKVKPQIIKIDTELYTATLDNKGGVLKSFILKRFKEDGKNGVEMVSGLPGRKFGEFLSIYIPGDTELTSEINNKYFDISDETTLKSNNEKVRRITFTYQKTGLKITKTISFLISSPYQIQLSSRVILHGKEIPAYIELGPGITKNHLIPENRYQIPPQIVYLEGKSAETIKAKKINDEKEGFRTINGIIGWAGVQTKYFASIALPVKGFSNVIIADRIWKYFKPKNKEEKDVHIPSLYFPIEGNTPITLFIGPKAYHLLTTIRPSLAKTIDYGWFALIVKPLYYSLRFLNQFVHNWGWSIIVLTLLITLALFPVRYMQMKSMKEMQKIQPQIKAIQAKYKGQKSAEARQKMNAEMMQLYKEAGVNPMGGCLPLIVQLPFLYAFYRLLYVSIELWHQPFILWIKDLSAADPTYITPIAMGLTMIIQMKQTPAPPGQGSKMQKQLQYMMPIFLTLLFLNMSSGLVLYFLFSNVFGWGFQKLYETFTGTSLVPQSNFKKGKSKGKKKK